MSDENKRSHLEMIQVVINRMATNSLMLKGWSVVLVSALFALAASNSKPYFVYLAYFPAISFWLLDAYFLRQERLFCALYDHVRVLGEDAIDFSMDTIPFVGKVASLAHIAFSITLIVFHLTVIVSIIVVTVFISTLSIW